MSSSGAAFLAAIALFSLLGAGGGCAPRSVPPGAGVEHDRDFHYEHRYFSFTLTHVEVIGEEVKLTFMYTNRTEAPERAFPSRSNTYLVDNLGNRYQNTDTSLISGNQTFPPRVPEKVWFIFGKVHRHASAVNLAMKWAYGGPSCPPTFPCVVDITLRHIPLNWAGPSIPPPNVQAQQGRIQAEVIFDNQLGEPVVLYWVDLQGKETLYRELQPGETYRQGTFLTHSWRIRSKHTGEAKGTLVVDRSGQVVRITQDGLLVTAGGEKTP